MEAYHDNTRRVMSAAGWPWPEHTVLDPAKAPRFVHSVSDFLAELQSGCHIDEIVVFPDGIEKLGHAHALDPRLRAAAGIDEADCPAPSGFEMLQRLEADGLLVQKCPLSPLLRRRHVDLTGCGAGFMIRSMS